MFLGHLGARSLAAAAIGDTFFSMIRLFLFGMSSALDTFASQAYGQRDDGSCAVRVCSNPRTKHSTKSCVGAVVYWTGVAFAVMTAVLVPFTVVLLYATDIMDFVFDQPDDITAAVSQFQFVHMMHLHSSLLLHCRRASTAVC